MKKEEFGKDLGLMHEVIITGRKVGAGSRTYSFLADNQEWLELFSNLSRHISVMKEHAVAPVVVNEEEVQSLISTIKDCLSSCICQLDVVPADTCPVFVPSEVFHNYEKKCSETDDPNEKKLLTESFKSKFYELFNIWLERHLQNTGIHPAEVAEFFPAYRYYADITDGWLLDRSKCIRTKKFTDAILFVFRQRTLISMLQESFLK